MIDNLFDINDLRIHEYPDPILRAPAGHIERIDDRIVALSEKMVDLMVSAAGIGLAGPQLGVPLRIIAISLTGKDQDAQVLINPELGDFHDWVEMEEGCLSVPGIRGKVRRPACCSVQAVDLDGNSFTMDLVDMAARVVQHESDHLDGTLFIDRLSPLSRITSRKAIKQLERRYSQR